MGAQDYLVKGEATADVIERSILYSVERKKAQESIKNALQSYADLVREIPFGPAHIPVWVAGNADPPVLEPSGRRDAQRLSEPPGGGGTGRPLAIELRGPGGSARSSSSAATRSS